MQNWNVLLKDASHSTYCCYKFGNTIEKIYISIESIWIEYIRVYELNIYDYMNWIYKLNIYLIVTLSV